MKKHKKERSFFKRFLKTLLKVAIFLVVLVLIVVMIFAIYVNKKIEKNVDEDLFGMVGSASGTEIYYYEISESTGEIEAVKLTDSSLYGGYRCEYVSYDNIPQDMIDAFVSIEDKRFYSHKGVDWKRTISAGLNYFLKLLHLNNLQFLLHQIKFLKIYYDHLNILSFEFL